MNNIRENVSLKELNTFGIEAFARYFVEVNTEKEALALQSVIPEAASVLILGGGSNILFTKDFEGWVIKNNIQGILTEVINEEEVVVKVGAGVNWHEWVLHSLREKWYGLENLSLIPGCVGAAPMQNIGAYGAEVKDTFDSLEGIFFRAGEKKVFRKPECEFGYRESIFKKRIKDFLITHVRFRLSRVPKLNTGYGDIQKILERLPHKEYTPEDVSNAVIQIRKSKLPNPEVIGNAGSFFKNPIVQAAFFEELRTRFGDIPHYSTDNDSVKIPAAWLIQQCEWKGKRFGNFGVHENQALVLVNYGGAKGNDILSLSQEIIESVRIKFGIILEKEVNIVF